MSKDTEKFLRIILDSVDPADYPSQEEFSKAVSDMVDKVRDGEVPVDSSDETKAYGLYCDAIDLLEDDDEASFKKAKRLLAQAVKLDAHCFDAKRVIALLSATSEQEERRLAALEKEACEHCTSAGMLTDDVHGDAWGSVRLRPYLRVKEELAYTAFDQGKYRLALRECEELLELTESDDQGMRYLAMVLYAYFEDEDSAKALYKRFDEERCVWFLLSLAILSYKCDKLSSAKHYISELDDYCPKAIPMLLGNDVPLPESGDYEPGSEEEVEVAADDIWLLVDTTYGFMDWLADNYC